MLTRERVPMVYSRAEHPDRRGGARRSACSSALIAVPVLVTLAAVWFGDATTVVAAAVYGLSLIAMFVCSAIYNLVPLPAWKDLLRRIDQSAIYVKIAGSYTPVRGADRHPCRLLPGRRLGHGAAGASLILLSPARLKWASLLLYLGARLGRGAGRRAAARRR